MSIDLSTAPHMQSFIDELSLSSKEEYSTLFDPRIPRASYEGKDAQAEAICGTHLYAYLNFQHDDSPILEIVSKTIKFHEWNEFVSIVDEYNIDMDPLLSKLLENFKKNSLTHQIQVNSKIYTSYKLISS